MSDYGTMVLRIEDEIHRSNLETEVRRAILSAIAHYEQGPPFFFNTERATATTVVGQKFMPTPTDFVDWIGRYPLQITVNQSTYPLNRRSWDYLQLTDLDAVVGYGIPFDWAYGDELIRLYPIPQAAYALSLYYKKRLPTLSNDTDANDWVDPAGGERLIRARAKHDLYSSVIHQYDKAQVQKNIEMEAYDALKAVGHRQATTGFVMPSYL